MSDIKFQETKSSLIIFLDTETLTVHKKSEAYKKLKKCLDENDEKGVRAVLFKKNSDKIKKLLFIKNEKKA